MKLLKRFFIPILILFSITLGVYAIPDSKKGAILEMFREKQYNLLFESSLGGISDEDKEIFTVSNRMNLYDKIRINVEGKRMGYEEKRKASIEKVLSLEAQLESLNRDIEDYAKNISSTNDKIIDAKKEVKQIAKTVEILKKKIEDSREILLVYLRYLYKKSESVSHESEFDNLKSILLNSENISQIVDDIYFKTLIEIKGKELVDQHRAFVSEIYIKKLELEKQQRQLKKLRKFLIIQRSVLKDKKEFKTKVLALSKGKQAIYERYIQDKQEVEKKLKVQAIKEKIKFNSLKDNLLEKYGCEFTDINKNSLETRSLSDKCYTLNKIIYSESKLKGFGDNDGNIFEWPIKPELGISAYYHDSDYKKLFGAIHDAIDIVAIQGTPIQAPADGYVIYVEPPTSQDYSFLAIRHSNGYVTVYGHLSEVLVSEFDFIKKGQVFAKSGGEFGTIGAGYMTTGPHLHFEVFEDKEAVNPLNYLSLAELKYNNIPAQYKFKFLADFKREKGYSYDVPKSKRKVFSLEGNNEIQRQKNLIDKYAIGAFRDWNMWVEESLDGGIDPTFVMCIGLAETGLGKNVKTAYNVGNVGNTDSGATRVYPNARSGIYAIVRTLNNRILGGYNVVSDLSRYGNKKGPIYASSPDHWHNNIIKCMSHIKGKYVPDNYHFRIVE